MLSNLKELFYLDSPFFAFMWLVKLLIAVVFFLTLKMNVLIKIAFFATLSEKLDVSLVHLFLDQYCCEL